jgi:hypothetical protein
LIMTVPNKPLEPIGEPEADNGAAAKATSRSNGKATRTQAASDTARSNDVEGRDWIEPIAAASALETKLAFVLDMRIEGRSQAHVAAHFGVTERTVRRWEGEARRRGITPLRDREPFEFTRESLDDLAEFRADVLARYRTARDAEDHNSMIKWLKMLSHVRQEKDRVLAMCGHINVLNKKFPSAKNTETWSFGRQ